MTSVSKNVYISKLDNECYNTYHRTIKMKPADAKDNACIDFSKKLNNKDSKSKAGGHVRTSRYSNILQKNILQTDLKNFFVIKEVKNTVPWTYVINDLNGEEIIGTFYEKEL